MKSLKKNVKHLALVALLLAVVITSGGVASASSLFDYTVPTGIIPADVSSANMIGVFSQFITNPAVLTLILAGLAVGLFRQILKATSAAKKA